MPTSMLSLHQGAAHFMYTYDCGTSGPYINYREVFARSAISTT